MKRLDIICIAAAVASLCAVSGCSNTSPPTPEATTPQQIAEQVNANPRIPEAEKARIIARQNALQNKKPPGTSGSAP